MNLEGLTLHILTNKLQTELLGGKIYKVFMPSHESLLLLVKRERDTAALLADFSGGCICRIICRSGPKVRRRFVCCCASIWKKAASPGSSKAVWTVSSP